MSALALFYCPDLRLDCAEVIIADHEARHIYGARRFGLEARVQLSDGEGLLAEASISPVDKKKQRVSLQVASVEKIASPKRQITLVVAPPKGDRQATLLDMATQLGVSRIVPLTSQNSIAKIKPASLQRWRRLTIESSKQARRAWFPTIDPSLTLTEWMALNAKKDNLTLLLDQNGKTLSGLTEQVHHAADVVVLVGPEGGFSEPEQSALRDQGAYPVQLGQHILRIETAAVAIISALNHF